MRYCIRFRPSGHSEDGSVIGTFKTPQEAKSAVRRLRNKLQRPCRAHQERVVVYFNDGEAGCLEDARTLMLNMGAIEATEHTEDFVQELVITITLPKGITDEAIQIVLDEDTQKLMVLLSFLPCQKSETRNHTVLTYRYKSEEQDEDQPALTYYVSKSGERQFEIDDNRGYRIVKASKFVKVGGVWW